MHAFVCDSSDATGTTEPKARLEASLDEVERDRIRRVLAESLTLEDAAETLGINVSTAGANANVTRLIRM